MPAASVEEFDRLLTSFEHRFWRWEAQPVYNEPEEAEPFARWKAGHPDDLAWLAGWFEQVRVATQTGKRSERVRLLTDPLTDYLVWEMTIYPANITAGEDIRLIDDHDARELGLPVYDFVLIDDHIVAKMQFGKHGFIGADLFTDPTTVNTHREWRDLAWRHATTFSEYASRSP